VPQERSLFPLMTVWDNVLIGGQCCATNRSCAGAPMPGERFPLIPSGRRDRAGAPLRRQQKLIEIARALMLEPEGDPDGRALDGA